VPDPAPGARCQLEQVLRSRRFVRVDGANRWTPGVAADPLYPLVGSVDRVTAGDASTSSFIAITGWVTAPAGDDEAPVIDSIELFLGDTPTAEDRLALGQLGLPRADIPLAEATATNAGFVVNLPLGRVPVGSSVLTLAAHSPERGTWQTTLQVVVPQLGSIPPARPKPVVAAPTLPLVVPPRRVEIQSPQPGDRVPRSFTVQVHAPSADRIDIFLDPGRDRGGRLLGSGLIGRAASDGLQASINAPIGMQTLYVHVHDTSGKEDILPLQVLVN
jgi:hypothetical protein